MAEIGCTKDVGVFGERTSKLALKHYDIDKKKSLQSNQSFPSKVQNENHFNPSVAVIETENETVVTDTLEGAISNTELGVSSRRFECVRGTVAEDASNPLGNVSHSTDKLLDVRQFGLSQSDVFIKVEKMEEEEELTYEFADCSVAQNSLKTEVDDHEEMVVENINDMQGKSCSLNFERDLIKFDQPQPEVCGKTRVNNHEEAMENPLALQGNATCLLNSQTYLAQCNSRQTGFCMKATELKEEEVFIRKSEDRTPTLNFFETKTNNHKKVAAWSTNHSNPYSPIYSKSLTDPGEVDLSGNFVWIKTEVEEEEEERSSVASEPGRLENCEVDSESSSKIVKYEGNDFWSEEQQRLSTSCPDSDLAEGVVGNGQQMQKALSENGSENKLSIKLYPCAAYPNVNCEQSDGSDPLNIHGDSKPIDCKQSPATFAESPSLQHCAEKRFTCDQCPCKFRRQAHLQRHLNVHAAEKRFSCNQCSAKFSQREYLHQHLSVHSTEKRFTCDECLANFSRKAHLQRHLSMHSVKKPFTCDQCPAEFRQKEYLQRHLSVHSDKKPFPCDQCPLKFSQNFCLQRHFRSVHTSEKPFTCDQCALKFSRKFYLQRHLKKVHTSEKPFTCDQCATKFRQKKSLKQHMKVHSAEKPFTCNQCSAKFRKKRDFRRHLTVHSAEKPFTCDQCPAKFRRKDALGRHKSVHSAKKSSSQPILLNLVKKEA